MLGIISRRFFHTSHANFVVARSSALGKLRKSTGYSISNCKKALEMFPEDVVKAEEWLHNEAKQQGWSKWAKIQTRSAMQGLVGVFSKDKLGVMVEVNCETDFVARNEEFHELVENILSGCMKHASTSSVADDVTKTVLNEAQLNEIKHNSSTLGELVNAAICKFNEKTVAKRAICFKVKHAIDLKSLSHPRIACPNLPGATLGKYGTILAFKNKSDQVADEDLSLNVCQHIIGMNPLSIGQLTEQDIINFTKKLSPVESDVSPELEIQNVNTEGTPENAVDQDDPETEGQNTLIVNLKDTDEVSLLHQPFLLDQTVSVGEMMYKSGVEVVDFERFECGESSSETVEAKESAIASN